MTVLAEHGLQQGRWAQRAKGVGRVDSQGNDARFRTVLSILDGDFLV